MLRATQRGLETGLRWPSTRGTQGETPDTAKGLATDYRASSRPYHVRNRSRWEGGPASARPLSFARIRSEQQSFTSAQLVNILQRMRAAIRTVVAVRPAAYARRDLLLELFALHHQLACSPVRLHGFGRLIVCSGWACGGGGRGGGRRWCWSNRQRSRVWHRYGLRRCWRRRAGRRPGRPRIKAELRGLIQRMATENRLLGGAANSRRVAEARDGRLGTHGVTVSARPTYASVADVADIPCQPPRDGIDLDGDVSERTWR